MKKIIKNIGMLDIRNTTEEAIQDIEKIGNIGTLIYSRKTAHLITKMNIGNLGSSMEVPDSCSMNTGQIYMSHSMIQIHKEPVTMVIIGQLVFLEDVTQEDIEKNIDKILITGQILCPERIAPAVQNKLVNMTGQFLSYKDGVKVVTGSITFDNSYLRSHKEPVSLMVFGKIKLTEHIDINLFEEKIKEIDVFGKIITKEEYLEVLYSKLKDKKIQKMEIIPQGYIYVEEELNLDSLSIKKFNDAKIYTRQTIRFEKDISEELLRKHIKSLKTYDTILCNEILREDIISICDDLSPKILSYKGKLIEVEGEYDLTSSELEYSPAKLTYVVKGRLKIDPEVQPGLIMEKIDSIDNFGEIITDSKQLGAISLLMRTRSGEVVQRDKENKENKENDTVVISNIGALAL